MDVPDFILIEQLSGFCRRLLRGKKAGGRQSHGAEENQPEATPRAVHRYPHFNYRIGEAAEDCYTKRSRCNEALRRGWGYVNCLGLQRLFGGARHLLGGFCGGWGGGGGVGGGGGGG